MKRGGIFILLFAMAGMLSAQDPAFTQLHSAPLYLNPSFAGSEGCSRVALNYRNQWSNSFETYNLSYDQYVRPLRGGIGLYSMYDAGWAISTHANYALYAFKWNIKNKLNLSPSVKFGYVHKVLNWEQLNFGDMIDPRYGFIYQSGLTSGVTSTGYIDMGFGLMANTKKFHSGLAFDHVTQPPEAFTNSILEVRLPAKYTFHFAYDVQKNEDSKFTFIPAMIYQKQQDFSQISILSSFRFNGLLWSVGYGDREILMLGLGGQTKRFRVKYSYAATLTRLQNLYGSHEVSLGFLFNCKNKKEHIIPVESIAF